MPKCVHELDLLSEPQNGLSAHTVGFLASSWFFSDLCEGQQGTLRKNLANCPGVVSGMHCYFAAYAELCRGLENRDKSISDVNRKGRQTLASRYGTPQNGNALGVWEDNRCL